MVPLVSRTLSFASFVLIAILCTSSAFGQSTFTVTNTNDAGAGSLRQAIEDANATAGADVIAFNIPGNGPHTIQPQAALPFITDPVELDGLSQAGADCSSWPPQLQIELNGTNAEPNAVGVYLDAGSDGSTVRGLVINDFFPNESGTDTGLAIVASNDNSIGCNFIGTDVNGSQSRANQFGLSIVNGSGNRIGGLAPTDRNLLSGNGNNVFVLGLGANGVATNNRIQGNFIGTDMAGTALIGANFTNVIIQSASGNLVGGVEEGASNVIAGAEFHGVIVGVFAEGEAPAINNTVQGNLIGTDVTGTQNFGNARHGVFLFNASENQVGGVASGAGNVISGSGINGVFLNSTGIAPTTNNTIQGNYIGTNAAGTAAIPNSSYGISIFKSSHNLVGGGEEGARNVVSGNLNAGVLVVGEVGGIPADNNRIENNFIGTNEVGDQAIGNANQGVFIGTSTGNEIIANVISGNANRGIHLAADAPGNIIQGNYIGTDASGLASLGQETRPGIGINSGQNIVGGMVAEDRNVIGANNVGIAIQGPEAVGNQIAGNYIGVGADGTTPIGNVPFTDENGTLFPGYGIILWDGATDNMIGGVEEGAGNHIANNDGAGILVLNEGTVGNALLGNAVYQNDGLGINLDLDGVTNNDNGDGDLGPNALQNAPVITNARLGNSITIDAKIDTTPSMQTRVEYFASATCDPSGFGEGEQFIGAIETTTDAAGMATFSVTLDVDVADGSAITATATDSLGNTSEFSDCFVIGVDVASEDEVILPAAVYELEPNFPNPFQASTSIGYHLPEASHVQIEVFDALGRSVALLENNVKRAGRHEVVFEASQLRSGVYLYRMETNQGILSRRMILLK